MMSVGVQQSRHAEVEERRPWQFGLRGLFMVVAIAAVLFITVYRPWFWALVLAMLGPLVAPLASYAKDRRASAETTSFAKQRPVQFSLRTLLLFFLLASLVLSTLLYIRFGAT